jgi:hypothetical protein
MTSQDRSTSRPNVLVGVQLQLDPCCSNDRRQPAQLALEKLNTSLQQIEVLGPPVLGPHC